MTFFGFFSSFSLVERVVALALLGLISVSGVAVGRTFWHERSVAVPLSGGSFTEGVIGKPEIIHPILAVNDVDRDISRLVFCSLMRFSPKTGEITDGIASHTLSVDRRSYTFTLKEGITWHDGMPITADDIVFTFRDVLQSPVLSGTPFAEDMKGVLITKQDDRTVIMQLPQPYAFFIFNTTVGLLPAHILKEVPVEDLVSHPFNTKPVGCGPYMLDDSTPTTVRLSAFENYYAGKAYIDSVIFRLFPDGPALQAAVRTLSATRFIPAKNASAVVPAKLTVQEYQLPQYVAVFLNTKKNILSDNRTRLALQLATDKERLAEQLPIQVQILDTPLLEIATDDWRYAYSPEKADGALFDAGFRYEHEVAVFEEAAPLFIQSPTSEEKWATDRTSFFVSGVAPVGASAIRVNGYQLRSFSGGSQWSYKADVGIGTLSLGENTFIVEAAYGTPEFTEIDRVTILVGEEVESEAISSAEPKKIESGDGIRVDATGARLSIALLVPERHKALMIAASELKRQWKKRGVEVVIQPENDAIFSERLRARDYDAVLFGQNLGYNLDAYAFWHSSQAKEGGSNVSNLTTSAVNTWLEQIRSSFDSSERRRRLSNLKEALEEEVPAITLYTPSYAYSISREVQGVGQGRQATHADRFDGIDDWYVKSTRKPNADVGIFAFLKWFVSKGL